MRGLLIVLAVAGLGACNARNGTYLVVQGSAALTFDRVEFFFGTVVDEGMPTTPAAAPAR